ncbi:glucose-1-phosphate adenylyltransferase family protein [Chloroflexota bacterium]
MNNIMAIILAGGCGNRMGVLCQLRPKPLLPVGDKFRVMDFTLNNCINSNIDNITILVDHKREQLKNYVSHITSNTPFLQGYLNVLEPSSRHYRGTADVVYQNLDYIEQSGSNRVLILSADHVYKMDYQRMLTSHENTSANVTVAVVTVPVEQASRFGTVIAGPDGRITGFIEKSGFPESNVASMGIYIFNHDVLKECLLEDAENESSRHDFGYAIIPEIIKRYRVFAYRYDGYWRDVGTIGSYYEANMEFLDRFDTLDPDFSQFNFVNSFGLTQPIVYDEAAVSNSIISPGCIIKGRVENSVLSPNVHIGVQAVLRDSIVMAKR